MLTNQYLEYSPFDKLSRNIRYGKRGVRGDFYPFCISLRHCFINNYNIRIFAYRIYCSVKRILAYAPNFLSRKAFASARGISFTAGNMPNSPFEHSRSEKAEQMPPRT